MLEIGELTLTFSFYSLAMAVAAIFSPYFLFLYNINKITKKRSRRIQNLILKTKKTTYKGSQFSSILQFTVIQKGREVSYNKDDFFLGFLFFLGSFAPWRFKLYSLYTIFPRYSLS